jgi:hypothetical protein
VVNSVEISKTVSVKENQLKPTKKICVKINKKKKPF